MKLDFMPLVELYKSLLMTGFLVKRTNLVFQKETEPKFGFCLWKKHGRNCMQAMLKLSLDNQMKA